MKLLESWTFLEPLPEPVKTLAEKEGRKTTTYLERCSAYNNMSRAKKATLHGPTLRGIEKFLEVWEQEKGAAGLVCDTEGKVLYYCMEYDHPAGRCAFLYNPANGGFFQRQKNTGKKTISRQIGPDGTDGNFCMMMLAFASYAEGRVQDREFLTALERYRNSRETDDAQCIEAAYILCDNLYRRLVRRLVPCSSEVAENGKIGNLEEEDFGMYVPDVVLKGQFQLFQKGKEKRNTGKCTVREAMEKYHWGKALEEDEKGKIPDIPEDYVVSANAENILRKIRRTGMRNFMLRGEAGTGKTTTVQIIAKCLGLPYYYFCCGEGTEESDLISSYMPNTGKRAAETGIKADWRAFMMDPAGVLMELTGNYEEGCTDGKNIRINAAAAARSGSREQKVLGIVGVAAHECGHINFSNFEKRRLYASGIREGILYPELPEPENEQERQALAELQTCLNQKKERELRVIRETLLYLHNILEDMYIEARQCAEYGGMAQKAIRFMGRWDMEQAESIRQMQEYGMDSLSIMKNVLLQYLRTKKVNDWEHAGGIYMEMLEQCKGTLDQAVIPTDEDVRFRAANKLLLILWEFVKAAFEQKEDGKEPFYPEYEGSSGKEGWKESEAVDTKEKAEKRRRAAAVLGGEVQEKTTGEDSVKEISDAVGKIVTEMEQEMLEQELKESMDKLELGKIHEGHQLRIIRPEPTSEQITRYAAMKKKVDASAEKMVRLTASYLEEQERFQKGMVQGKKVCGNQIYRRDRRIFGSRNLPGDRDAAVAVLIDESASMDIYNRIGSARYTACVLYRFCQRLGIPVLILGHSTGIGEKKESVELYSYAEFDTWDQKDCFRLTGICSRWNNRDGAALAYAGLRLGRRAEGQKLLFVISDGLPLAEGYRGEAGIADTRREREKLEHKGIHVMAAAIGEDRELIERIYGKGFLNISDTERMPAAMAGIIRQYTGR